MCSRTRDEKYLSQDSQADRARATYALAYERVVKDIVGQLNRHVMNELARKLPLTRKSIHIFMDEIAAVEAENLILSRSEEEA
jgi:hypothetical protein